MTGQVVPTGVFDRAKVLTLFAFVTVIFLLLAWRTQINTHAIQLAAYRNCLGQVQRVEKLNATARGFIDIESNNHVAAPEVTAKRLQLYRDSILTVPTCPPKP